MSLRTRRDWSIRITLFAAVTRLIVSAQRVAARLKCSFATNFPNRFDGTCVQKFSGKPVNAAVRRKQEPATKVVIFQNTGGFK
jgi:hypothetical protein